MKFHYFGTIDSTFNKAFELANKGRLADWDCVIARSQTAGRGQLRKSWISEPGNLFLSIRLPLETPFATGAGAVVTGALCVDVLREIMECQIFLKWPNDLVILKKDQWRKAGGILLEEHGNVLIAGIGIDLSSAPLMDELDFKDALGPGSISQLCGITDLDPFELGRKLARGMHERAEDASSHWQAWANKYLAWKGAEVCLEEQASKTCGILMGISGEGACIIKNNNMESSHIHGSMRLRPN